MGLFDRWRKKKNSSSEDINNFIIEMFERVSKKCGFGENTGVLSGPERVFYIVQIVETEVNNGGFSQFFYNSGRIFAEEMAEAFAEIGAARTAEICIKAIKGRNSDSLLEKCDDMFYEYKDDLNALNYAYIMDHKEFFELERKG